MSAVDSANRALYLLRSVPDHYFTLELYFDVLRVLLGCQPPQTATQTAELPNLCSDTTSPVDAPDKPVQRATEGVQ